MAGGRGRRARGTLVWDAARSRFFPETCGLFTPRSDCGEDGEVDEWGENGELNGEDRRRERAHGQIGGCRQSSGGTGTGLSSRSGFLAWTVFGSGNAPFGQDTRVRFKACNSIIFANFLLTSVHMGAI